MGDLGRHKMLIAGLCVCLTAVVALELGVDWRNAGSGDAIENASDRSDELAQASARVEADIEVYREVIERPLFSETRLPVVTTVAGPAPTGSQSRTPVSGQITLLSIVIEDDKRQALVKFDSNETRLISQGEGVDGWRLTEVSSSGARLERGDRVQQLELVRKSSPQARKARPRRKRREAPAATAPDKSAAASAEPPVRPEPESPVTN